MQQNLHVVCSTQQLTISDYIFKPTEWMQKNRYLKWKILSIRSIIIMSYNISTIMLHSIRTKYSIALMAVA